jgi:hypothetical protein
MTKPDRNAGFAFLQDRDNLRFRKSRLPHDIPRVAGRVYYPLCTSAGSLRHDWMTISDPGACSGQIVQFNSRTLNSCLTS